MNLKAVGTFFKETFSRWSDDKASRLAAALAYYTLFSLAPLLVIVIVAVGQIFGQGTVKAQILSQIQSSLGPGTANMIQTMIEGAARPGSGIVATAISVVTILLGAMGVFGQLHEALNTIWHVEPQESGGLIKTIKDRALSFLMVLGIGFLFLLLFLLSTALSIVQKYLGNFLPGSQYAWQGLNFAVPFVVMTLLFAMIYKFLPDAAVAWRDVWVGALATAVLMSVGNLAIGLYLGHSSTASAYGAAGSLVLLLLWLYYSAQIFFLGAEMTQVYAGRYGARIRAAGAPGQEQPRSTGPKGGRQAPGKDIAAAPPGGEAPGETPTSLALLFLIAATAAAIAAGLVRGSRGQGSTAS